MFFLIIFTFQEVKIMAHSSSNSNQKVVPEAADALNKFKYEVASEVGVNLKDGYNGDISARDAGRIGGNMVKKLIQQAENQMKQFQFYNLFYIAIIIRQDFKFCNMF